MMFNDSNGGAETLKQVHNMRISHSNMNTRPESQPRAKRKHLQSAVTRTMAPRLTMPDESEMSGTNLLPPMAPNMNRPVNIIATATQSRFTNSNVRNLIDASGTNSFSAMNHTSHTVLPHQRTRMTITGQTKSLSKQPTSTANNIYAEGSKSIRTLIRLANSRGEEDDDEVRTIDDV